MASIAKSVCFAKQTIHGSPAREERFPEAAAQTFKKGEIVYLLDGYVTECGDNPAAILGVAAEDGHNSTTAGDDNVAVTLAEPTTLFCMNIASSTSFGSRTLAQIYLGRVCVLLRDTTNSKLYCDPATLGSNARVIVDKFVDEVGDVNGRVLVRFKSTAYQLASSS